MARTGRKRALAKRDRSGKATRARDTGTPETTAHRNRAMSGKVDSQYPLEVLFLAGDITLGERNACEYFGFLRYACFGRPNLASVSYGGDRPSGNRKTWPDERVRELRRDYDRIRAEIADTRALVALDDMIVFEHMPRWTGTKSPSQSDVNTARILFAAVKRLAVVTGYRV